MRIRKNAKLSPLLFSSSSSQGGGGGGSVQEEAFQTHVCQLNQSPWDVIPFDFDSIKFEVDDRFNNGSAGDSFGTVENESVASMMDTIDDVAMMVLDDNHDNLHGKKVAVDNNGYKGLGKKKNSCCNASDTKSLLCKNGVKQGHHLSLLRSHSHNNNGNNSTVKKTQPGVVAGSRRGRPRAATTKKGSGSSSSSNPNEFYYYSGFGPLWGKRRGDKNGETSKNIGIEGGGGGDSTMLESSNVNANNVSVLGGVDNVVVVSNYDVPSSEINNNIGVFDFVDDDDEEDCDNDDDDDNGKKRMRKPVKERSLKSLM